MLTAISYMLPLVVASGLLIAVGNLMGGEVVTDLSKMTVPSALLHLVFRYGVITIIYWWIHFLFNC